MEKTIFELGTIELGGYVYVTDPSYSPGIWCQALIKNVKSGKYHAFMNKVTIPNWGRVVSELWVCHEDSTKDFPNTFVDGVEIGVDSGAAGIFDREYYEKHHQVNGELDEKWCDRQFNLRYEYDIDGNKMEYDDDGIQLRERRDGVAIDGKACVSFSGYGDGSYELYVTTDDNGNVVSIGIKFLEIK